MTRLSFYGGNLFLISGGKPVILTGVPIYRNADTVLIYFYSPKLQISCELFEDYVPTQVTLIIKVCVSDVDTPLRPGIMTRSD